jgi:uncharacterized protein (DUF4415 family)
MANPPRRPPPGRDYMKAAEAVFKPAPPKTPDAPRTAVVPGVKESVTLRIDSDVLAHFQQDGPGWQDRINAALRKAAGI